jgi:hypothetical protein
MQILKAGSLYFALVFGAGFLLGPIRMLWVVPRVGERTAELMESPIMLVVVFLAARWIVRRFALPPAPLQRLGVGLLALGLLLLMEFSLVLALRGLTIREYLAARDPVAEAVYRFSLGIFALMPLILSRVS